MPRLMSVAYTERAVVERRKTVTRRAGWWLDKNGRRLLHVGNRLTLCRKVMGRKPGEPLVRLVDVEVLSVRREPLHFLTDRNHRVYAEREVALEGFHGMDPHEFVQRFFVDAQGMSLDDDVTRIEWRYLEHDDTALAHKYDHARGFDRPLAERAADAHRTAQEAPVVPWPLQEAQP